MCPLSESVRTQRCWAGDRTLPNLGIVLLSLFAICFATASSLDARTQARSTTPGPIPESAAIATVAARAPRPNIVVFSADDLGYGDLSSYGHPAIRTPEIDRLAAEGQRWTDFYAMAPVCSPSRAALLTGRLPVRSGIYGKLLPVYFPDDPGGLPASEVTIAEVMRSVGYRTAIYGKWHLGDRREAWPTRHGFDQWVGIPYSNDMDWAVGPDVDELVRMTVTGRSREVETITAQRMEQYLSPESAMWKVPLIESRRTDSPSADDMTNPSTSNQQFTERIIERSPDQSQLTRKATQYATQFIDEAAKAGDPFFVYVPYSMPHTPIFPSNDFTGHSAAGRYGDVVEEIDWSVGVIRRKVEELGIARNTLIVFTSDNGPWLAMSTHSGSPGPLRNGKGTTFEGGMRVPGVFWWPGTIVPQVVHGIGTAMDLFATFAKLGGADLDPEVVLDAIDLSPALLGTGPSPRTSVPFYRQGVLTAFREGRYKIHFVTEGAYSMEPPRTEHSTPLLFDLNADHGERHDLSARMPEVVARLVESAERHRRSFEMAPPSMDQRVGRAAGQEP